MTSTGIPVYEPNMQTDFRNICLIDAPLPIAAEFENTGYSVLRIQTSTASFFDLPAALDEQDFIPDLIIQCEKLGERSIVTGLDTFDCPLLLWCIDPHLNAHWHSAYARLFDLVCCTQKAWIPQLEQQGAKDVRWLPWFGHVTPWTDWKDRTHGMAFVGRITQQRPARKWMVDFLQNKAAAFHPVIRENIAFKQMMQLYCESKIIPNESILGEVNFRLFEAASCGCLVLSQALGEEQEELFEPGREFDTYSHVVDLDEKLSIYLNNTRLAQTMGRAAFERIKAEHLPKHRIQRLLEYAKDATRKRATGPDVDKWITLTACAMWEAKVLRVAPSDLLTRLSRIPQDKALAIATLRIQAALGQTKFLKDNISTLLRNDLYADSPALNLAGSMAALRSNYWDGAKAFWYRHLKATNAKDTVPPQNAKELLTLWAKNLKRSDMLIRAGFPFDAQRNLPATATECLLCILADAPQDLPTLRLLDIFMRPITGLEQARVGFLSILTLHSRKDWRLAFEIAMANLKSYRLESGLEELFLAREIAKSQGQELVFDKALKTSDPTNTLPDRIAVHNKLA